MALNTLVSPGGLKTVTAEFTDVDFSDGAEADVDISDLRHIGSVADVKVQGYGTGDDDADEGRVIVPVAVSGSTVTLHAYVGGGSGDPLDDDSESDVDHVLVEATGI